MTILWILIPSPFVGYLVIDHFRKMFSEDDKLIRKLFVDQPVTMLAGATSIGAIVVWALSEIVLNLFGLLP